MIVGHGDIASVLTDREDWIYFASGVSNSQETRQEAYDREITLLRSQAYFRHIVYFSSLSIYYSDSQYAKHKKEMESLVKMYFSNYTIIRIGNITWGDNPHTLINFIRSKIKNREKFEIQDTYRYVIEKDEFLHWIDLIPSFNCEMNIPGRIMSVKEIITKYCSSALYE